MSKYTENFPNLSTYDFDTIMCQLRQVCGADPSGLINAQFLSRPTTAKDIALLLHITYQLFQSQIELQKQFVELYTFVKDFFENLDLQEEVNNWLNNALKDGSLNEIISKLFSFYVLPEFYGAKGDGLTDDSEAIQKALDSGMNVIFTKKYIADSLIVNKEIGIFFLNNSEIKSTNKHPTEDFTILRINRKCHIYNPLLIGDYDTHQTSTEYCHGLAIYGDGTTVINANIRKCKGDCIYINANNVKLLGNTFVDYAWRNGLSLINGNNFFCNYIKGTNIVGTAPNKVVDIEPNNSDQSIENFDFLLIDGENVGGFLSIALNGAKCSGHIGKVKATKNRPLSFNYLSTNDTSSGNNNGNNDIIIDSVECISCSNIAIDIGNWNNTKTPTLIINNIIAVDYSQTNQDVGNAFVYYALSANINVVPGNFSINNIEMDGLNFLIGAFRQFNNDINPFKCKSKNASIKCIYN